MMSLVRAQQGEPKSDRNSGRIFLFTMAAVVWYNEANSSINKNLTKECDCMKKQLQGIAIILVSILLMLGFGNAPVFDLSFRWSVIFTIFGIVGAVMTFLPDKK